MHNLVLMMISYPKYDFSGNLLDETSVLEWMVDQKNDASIEEINRDTLFKYIETKEFLAVAFCKFFPSEQNVEAY